MTHAIGTVVRFVPEGDRIPVMIRAGIVGKVTGHDPVMGWPCVYFPFGTWGPHSTWKFANSAELVPVAVETLTERQRSALGV
jgi:hypothetical protein